MTDEVLIVDPQGNFAGGGTIDTARDIFTGPETQQDTTRQEDMPQDFGLGQSSYDFSSRVFPEDLGAQTYNGHYMIINMSVQTASNMNNIGGAASAKLATVLNNELSKTDTLRYNIDSLYTNSGGESLGQSRYLTRPRFTRRIRESIALYMPNAELTFNDTHDFENISLTKFGGSVVAGLATFAASVFGITAPIADSLSGAGQAAQLYGRPVNPKVEVLYANTMQREHRFDFIFAPSSENESKVLRQIIKTLRYHAAPELATGLESFFWIPPAEFDITFYNRGAENTAIPRINTCALTQIDVSYSPNGAWSTFYDGFPTQVRMQLAFREVEVTHKLRVLQGF